MRDLKQNLVNAENFVYQTQITLDGHQGDQLCQVGALWEYRETKTNAEIYNFTLPNPIPLLELRALSEMYVDLIGNSNSMGFMQ
jgi:hypothetical protein